MGALEGVGELEEGGQRNGLVLCSQNSVSPQTCEAMGTLFTPPLGLYRKKTKKAWGGKHPPSKDPSMDSEQDAR